VVEPGGSESALISPSAVVANTQVVPFFPTTVPGFAPMVWNAA
jgi:hypothetical protein